MATATVKPVEPIRRTVLLELTEGEALTLIYVSTRVGGSESTGTGRQHFNAVRDALCSALSISAGRRLDEAGRLLSGHLYFKNESV